MKKFLSIIIASIMLLSIAGCSKQETADGEGNASENNSTPVATEEDNSSSKSEDAESEEVDDVPYEKEIVIYSKRIFINYSNKRCGDTAYYGKIIHSDGYSFVAVAYDTDIQADYTEIFDLYNDGRVFKMAARFTMGGIVHTDDVIIMTATDKQITKINGYDAVKFEGFAGDSSQHYIYGYAFVVEDTPCMITGMVLNYEEHLDLKEAIVNEVERMAKTVRVEK